MDQVCTIIDEYISTHRVTGLLLKQLQGLDVKDAAAIADVIIKLSPSANTLRDLMTLLSEICARDGISLDSVIANEEVQDIWVREGVARKEKQKMLRQYLEYLRYPLKKSIADRLYGLEAQLSRKYGCSIALPPELEGDSIGFTLKARSVQELQKGLEGLADLPNDSVLVDLFELLLGRKEIVS